MGNPQVRTDVVQRETASSCIRQIRASEGTPINSGGRSIANPNHGSVSTDVVVPSLTSFSIRSNVFDRSLGRPAETSRMKKKAILVQVWLSKHFASVNHRVSPVRQRRKTRWNDARCIARWADPSCVGRLDFIRGCRREDVSGPSERGSQQTDRHKSRRNSVLELPMHDEFSLLNNSLSERSTATHRACKMSREGASQHH